VVAADIRPDGATLTLEPAAGGAPEKFDADVVLVAVGRRPRTEVCRHCFYVMLCI
jgi:dihydrolipoamide dehydrogenase